MAAFISQLPYQKVFNKALNRALNVNKALLIIYESTLFTAY